MIKLSKVLDREEWDDNVIDMNGHPFQLWGWGAVKELHGWSADRLLVLDENDRQIGLAQLLVRKTVWPFRSISYIPRGPVFVDGRFQEVIDAISDYAKKSYHSVAITIEPDMVEQPVLTGWRKSTNHILPAETIILDLLKTESELLAGMAKKTRQYIRKSEADGVTVRRVTSVEELQSCLDLYHETASRAGFNLHSDQYYLDIFLQMGENAPVFAAIFEGKVVSFLWLAISAETAYELYGGMNDVGHQIRANYILKWHAIRKCQSWGLKRYDFGGLIEGGVSNFKMGWAVEPTILVGSYDKPLSVFYTFYSRFLPFGKKILRSLKRKNR